MARCRVSYTNEQGVHSVEVTADTLSEAVALAVTEFRDDKTVAEPHPASGRRPRTQGFRVVRQARSKLSRLIPLPPGMP